MTTAESDLTDKIRRQSQSSAQTFFVPFRDGFASCPVINLPLDAPYFRANNGRLAVLKQAHIQESGLAPDHFEKTEQSTETQAKLQNFLTDLAQDENGPIFQELQRTAVQTEPLLITGEGLVINGNRRLAAMRQLYEEDAERFGGFSSVNAAILPAEAKLEDLEMTEAALQMAPETKLAYGWLDRRLKLRHHRGMESLSDEDIQQSYRLPSADQIDEELAELKLAERYLEEFEQAPGQYFRLSETEPYFAGLRRNLAILAPEEQESWTLAGFNLVAQAANLDLDPERYFPFVEPKPAYTPALCLFHLGNELELWPQRHRDDGTPALSATEHRLLQNAMSSADRAEHIAGLLVKLQDRILAEHREEQLISARHLIQSAHHLNRQLAKVGPENFTAEQRRQLGGLLVETQYHAKIIGGERKPSPIDRVLSGMAGWVYFIRRKALLFSKRGKGS